MKKFIIGFVILIVLIVVGLLALPSLIPSSVYKENIETQLTRELARDVRVQGDVKLSVFPVIKANTGRVEIDNPDGFTQERFIEMEAMSARIKLLPLFSKRVEIASFTLKNPSINLEKRQDGVANWVFGDAAEPQSDEDVGPFKRDGRYSQIDPNIGNFTLENGAITYADRQGGTDVALRDVNVSFELPSLSEPIAIEGSLIYNDTPATIDLNLNSIRAFLNGEEAPVTLGLKTDFADISAKGRFLAGQDITFDLNANADVSDVTKVAALSPTEIPNADLLNTAKLSGNYSYDGKVLKAKGADISATGRDFTGAFKGDATLAETPVFDGQVELDAKNVAALAKEFGQDIKGLSLLDAVKFSADLAGQAKGFKAENINANISGPRVAGTFTGAANYGDVISATGEFSTSATSISEILTALEMDIPQAKAVESLDASGQVSLIGETIKLTNVTAKTGGILNANYTGGASLGEVPAFDGTFNVAISSLSDFAKVTATEIPYADTIGKIAIDGQVTGQGENITLPQLTAALSGGKINGSYNGQATWNKGASLDGTLNIDIPSLRAVAKSAGTELPPSTPPSAIFERFSVNGTVKGTPENIQFSKAELVMDNINGQGDFAVNMTSAKPFVTGLMNLDDLDLSPYMAAYTAQNPTGEIQPWSTAPINTAPLRAVDGDFTLNTPNIKTDRLTMGQSEVTSKLRNGVLTTNMPNIALYGGLGRMIATLDGYKAEPQVSLDIGLNDINSNSFLASAAGFTQAEGELGSSFKITGRGTSQAAIMKSLNGAGDFKLIDGQISGVDLTALLTGLEQALTSRSIPTGIGPSHITKFKDLAGLVKIENGVASINKFSLEGLGVLADGSGQIDLGNQSIDFGLRPRLTGESASNIAAFGIPIEIKGSFGNAKVGLDADMLGQIATERARAEASKLIKDKVGGGLGDVLGGVIGDTSETPSERSEPKKTEEVVGDILGGLLGGNEAPEETPEEPAETEETKAEEEAKEPTVEDALLGIFGAKKKKKSEE